MCPVYAHALVFAEAAVWLVGFRRGVPMACKESVGPESRIRRGVPCP